MKYPFLILLCSIVCQGRSSVQLPTIPEIQHPPVPEDAQIGFTAEDAEKLLNDPETDPEVRPGLFQGDMAINDETYGDWRVGLRWDVFPDKLWKNRTVPYVISPLYETEHYVTIYKAITTINHMTCIRFRPWDGKAKDYLLIWPIKYPRGCWSYVGKNGGPQIVSLQPPDDSGPNCLGGEGRPIHELMHALGVFHEQSRADRDRFIKVHLENVIPEFKSNFDKQSLANTTYQFEYDFDSIMHYGRHFFSIVKGKPTITAKYPAERLGQRKMMSKTDCLKLNDLYGCLGKAPRYNRSSCCGKYFTSKSELIVRPRRTSQAFAFGMANAALFTAKYA